MRLTRCRSFAGCLIVVCCWSSVGAQVVYDTGGPTGFFTPFSSSTVAGKKFGDSGWFGTGSSAPAALTSITLGLATFGGTTTVGDGTTDILFTLNDGDPSGLVFGSGATLFSKTIQNVVLPAADDLSPSYFALTIDLPGIMTFGGFNNFGFSIGVENFNYAGQFGFQNHGDFNVLGFYTNNASEFTPGVGWSLFSFGPNDPADIANFVTTVTVPEPGLGFMAGLGALALLRTARRGPFDLRRRRRQVRIPGWPHFQRTVSSR